MDKIKPLFSATATAIGGRNGHTESSDGVVAADLSLPKEMGGAGKPGTATPEQSLRRWLSACFGGALDSVGKQHQQDSSNAKVTCAVSIGGHGARPQGEKVGLIPNALMVAKGLVR
jgi:organic hydroperoxide reductase OsmC/OhrA